MLVFAQSVDLKIVAGLLAALGIAAAAILKVWLDYKRALANPPAPAASCPMSSRHLEQLEELYNWHAPDDRGSGRQSWKAPAGQHEAIKETRGEVRELKQQLTQVESQLGRILEPYRPTRKDPTIP